MKEVRKLRSRNIPTHNVPSNPVDNEKAAAIVRVFLRTLAPYCDYGVAIKGGIEPFLINVPQLFSRILHVYLCAETPEKVWTHEPHT